MVCLVLFYFILERQRALALLERGHNVVLHGPPGSGKTSTVRFLVQAVNKRVAVTAATGIAVLSLRKLGLDASTIHRFTGTVDLEILAIY